jgi:hypothetical protein
MPPTLALFLLRAVRSRSCGASRVMCFHPFSDLTLPLMAEAVRFDADVVQLLFSSIFLIAAGPATLISICCGSRWALVQDIRLVIDEWARQVADLGKTYSWVQVRVCMHVRTCVCGVLREAWRRMYARVHLPVVVRRSSKPCCSLLPVC